LVIRYTSTKGRIVESAGTRTCSKHPGPDGLNTTVGADGVAAYKAQTDRPCLEGLAPGFSETDIKILMNSLTVRFVDKQNVQ